MSNDIKMLLSAIVVAVVFVFAGLVAGYLIWGL